MQKFVHEAPDITTGNPLVDQGFVEFVGTHHEASIVMSALELLVNEQKRLELMGTPSPRNFGAEKVLESVRDACFPHEDTRPMPVPVEGRFSLD